MVCTLNCDFEILSSGGAQSLGFQIWTLQLLENFVIFDQNKGWFVEFSKTTFYAFILV